MNNKRFDFGLLVTIICMFSMSVGFLHGRKNINPVVDQPFPLSTQDTIDLITPSLLAEDISSAVAILKELNPINNIDVFENIVANKGVSLSDDNKALLIIGVLPYVDAALKKDMYALLLRATPSRAFFYMAQAQGFQDSLPIIITLSKDYNNYHEVMIDSYRQAISADDIDAAQKFYSLSMRPDKIDSGNLLLDAINQGRNILFVSLFIQKLMVDPDFSPDGKRSLLMYAVENNNEPMVRALLEVGAHPDKILDDTVGSARQIAYEKKYIVLESILTNQK